MKKDINPITILIGPLIPEHVIAAITQKILDPKNKNKNIIYKLDWVNHRRL